MMQYLKQLFDLQPQESEQPIMATQKQEKPVQAPQATHQHLIVAQNGWLAVYADKETIGETTARPVIAWTSIERPGQPPRVLAMVSHPTHVDLVLADELPDFLGYADPLCRTDWRQRAKSYLKETYQIEEQPDAEQPARQASYDHMMPVYDHALSHHQRTQW